MLDPSPDNVREAIVHDDEIDRLSESIERHGVQQSLLVVPNPDREGRYMIIMGHRRHYAAGLLANPPLMPCRIRPPYGNRAEMLSAMVTENRHRQDISAIEEARAYEAMALDGLGEDAIANMTSTPKPRVHERRQLLGLRTEHQQRVHTGQLAIEHALAMVDFAKDAKSSALIDRAVESGDASQIRNAIALAKANREAAKMAAKTKAVLRKAGIEVVERDHKYTKWDSEYRLGAHNSLPGSRQDHDTTDCKHLGAYLPFNGQLENVGYVCLDPTQHGLPLPGHTDAINHLDDEEARAAEEAAEAERRRDAQEAAAGTLLRHDYVRALVQGEMQLTDDMAAAVHSYLLRLLVNVEVEPDPALLARFVGMDEDTIEVLESPASNWDDSREAERKLTDVVTSLPAARGFLAIVAAGADEASPGKRWYQNVDLQDWFTLLGGPLGYEWTEWEAQKIEEFRANLAALHAPSQDTEA